MKKPKKDKLVAAGWRIGTPTELLGMSDADAQWIEIKLAFAADLRKRRARLGWTQARAARAIGSSPSRLAKMEAAEASVSFDLLVRALLGLGASRKDVAAVMRGQAA